MVFALHKFKHYLLCNKFVFYVDHMPLVYVVANALLRLPDITKLTGLLDETIDASLFYTELEWLNEVKNFLRTKHIEGTLSIQLKQRLVRRAKPFTLKNGKLYKMGQDKKLKQCLTTT
jgi:hypothetical protein